MQTPIDWIKPHDCTPDTRTSGGGHGDLVPEEGDEQLSGPPWYAPGGDIEFHGGAVRGEAKQRRFRWRQVGVVSQHKTRGRSPLWSILGVGDGLGTDEIGPPIPGAYAYLIEQIRSVAHRA